MLPKVFQRNWTQWGHVKTPIKPHPNPPWGKPRFRVKSKMAVIIKPVIQFGRHRPNLLYNKKTLFIFNFLQTPLQPQFTSSRLQTLAQ